MNDMLCLKRSSCLTTAFGKWRKNAVDVAREENAEMAKNLK